MLRKNIRMAKEYLQNKSKQKKELQKYQKKLKIKQSLDNGTSIPTQIHYSQRAQLIKELQNDDDSTLGKFYLIKLPRTHIDDQYEQAKFRDPKILITTSRKPTSRLVQFIKQLKLMFPGAFRMNRGSFILSDLTKICQTSGFTDLIIAHQHNGRPDGLIISHLPYGPTAYFGLSNVILRHDVSPSSKSQKLDTISESKPHLIFDGFLSRLGKRLSDILKYLYPIPKVDSQRVMTFSNSGDIIKFRHHTYKKIQLHDKGSQNQKKCQVELKQIGPRFDMKPYQIVLGTVDISHAEKEWVLRPYMNAKNKKAL